MSKRHLLGVLSRGSTSEIRIEQLVYEGRAVVDLRRYVAYAGGALCPTKYGVRLYLDRDEVDAIIQALQRVQRE